MDEYLLDYLKSGSAWLLVGSGPSSAIGYPSWKQLADSAVSLCRIETVGIDLQPITLAYNKGNFPEVFQKASDLLGMPRLLHHLSAILPGRPGRAAGENIYSHLARWPVAVYLTTNYDHEIQSHLGQAGDASYLDYSNSPEHLSRLLPDASGFIVHLHGDLRSQNGLVLTSDQYDRILNSSEWEYWRTKMMAVFQMNRVIVIGHSLFDPHIRHVLEAARKGSGVVQPVCWIAPDVPRNTIQEYLEQYRIRLISYDNRDGTHRNLTKLTETISDFITPRLTIHLSAAVERAVASPLGRNAAATGFYVFNKLSAQTDFEEKQISVLVAALHAAIPALNSIPGFSIQEALELSGWPSGSPVPPKLVEDIALRAVGDGLLVPDGSAFRVSPGAEDKIRVEQGDFEHLRERFQRSIQFRLNRDFPSLPAGGAPEIASAIDGALAGFFREGGLTLASTLSAAIDGGHNVQIPTSVAGFITQAATMFNDTLHRQAFASAALGCFIRPEASEREYLGRVSQGFFGFHLLGVFGDAASERIRHAKETIWIVDSSAQIPAIAVGCGAHRAFRETFEQLSVLGLRFYTTEGLFEETKVHLWFAENIIKNFGPSSPNVISAAKGSIPYRKGNLFLEGFINWQAAGNPADWDRYLLSITGVGRIGKDAVRLALDRIPISSVSFSDWPGFRLEDHAEAEETKNRIIELAPNFTEKSPKEIEDLLSKAKPEAEVHVIVSHERDGIYRMLSDDGNPSSAWFLSSTSILNRVQTGLKVTWPPESFLRFASTLLPSTDEDAAERAFSTLLWTIAQSGLTILDDRVAVGVFGGVIDQAKLLISDQHAAYDHALSEKYGTPIANVLDQVRPLDRPLAALQLANERAKKEAIQRAAAESQLVTERLRASRAEAELAKVEKFRLKLQKKQGEAAERKRKSRSKRKRR